MYVMYVLSMDCLYDIYPRCGDLIIICEITQLLSFISGLFIAEPQYCMRILIEPLLPELEQLSLLLDYMSFLLYISFSY